MRYDFDARPYPPSFFNFSILLRMYFPRATFREGRRGEGMAVVFWFIIKHTS